MEMARNSIWWKLLNVSKVRAFVKPVYDTFDFFFQKTILEQNKKLENKFRGNRCFILSTGESLNIIDFDKLANEFTYGMAHLYTPRMDMNYLRGLTKINEDNEWPINL